MKRIILVIIAVILLYAFLGGIVLMALGGLFLVGELCVNYALGLIGTCVVGVIVGTFAVYSMVSFLAWLEEE